MPAAAAALGVAVWKAFATEAKKAEPPAERSHRLRLKFMTSPFDLSCRHHNLSSAGAGNGRARAGAASGLRGGYGAVRAPHAAGLSDRVGALAAAPVDVPEGTGEGRHRLGSRSEAAAGDAG